MKSLQRKILVVDDDPVVGKSFSRVLSTKGYAVITASSGEEAIFKMKTEKYDAVFTDLKMPKMSGIEVAKAIKEKQPWMPVVIVSGYGSESYRKEAEDVGVYEFLDKPLSPDMIEQCAERATHREEAIAEVVEQQHEEELQHNKSSYVKNISLFLLAPFIGLAYILAMPFVGLGVVAWFAGKWLMRNKAVQVIAAPFIGLAFITVAPVLGLGALVYYGGKSLLT